MQFKGRTVLVLVALSIVLSSVVTMLVLGTPGLAGGSNNEVSHPQTGQMDGDTEGDLNFSKIQEAYDIIRSNYVLDVNEAELLEGAVEGMLETLDDPYSVYMDPDAAEQFRSSLESSFEGIGAEVMMQDGRVTIVAPIRGAPAEKAGLRPNDQIISVNGESLEGLDLHRAVLKIRGPKDSEAELEVMRPGVSDPISITVTRDEIPLHTVYGETIRANGKTFGMIEITSFAQQTAQDFEEQLMAFEQDGIDGLVIDVRGNPGGYLEAVSEIGDLIVPNESVITKINSRNGEIASYHSTLEGKKPYPITILVDNGSASASEILAAALKEAGGYKVVGQQSFGKGTVQSTIPMGDDSEIKLTVAKWLTPDENWINGVGVEPDIKVEQPDYFHAVPIDTDTVYERDMNNSQVKNIQLMLRGLGYDPGREDGFYNEATERAVSRFQQDHSLTVSGKVDSKTAALLQEELLEAMRDPQNDEQLQKAVEVLLQELN